MSETTKIIAIGVSLPLIFISIAVCKAIGAIIKNIKQQKEEKMLHIDNAMRDNVEWKVDNQSIKIELGKVYILYEYVCGRIEFMGAFSTEEQAKKIKDILEEHTNNIYEIQEFELDKLTTKGTDEVLGIISNLKEKCGLEDTND